MDPIQSVTTASGLEYVDLVVGTGPSPARPDREGPLHGHPQRRQEVRQLGGPREPFAFPSASAG